MRNTLLTRSHKQQSGAVSIFIVLFTTLLVTVVATSFVQLMLRNQQQATNSDLSQSAYDSALAGVEDAKRVLVRLKQCERSGGSDCGAIIDAIDDRQCDTTIAAGVVTTPVGSDEVQVGEPEDNQAYTCVKINSTTTNYEGDLEANGSPQVIRLKGVSPFNRIRVSWFTKTNANEANAATYDQVAGNLPPHANWLVTQPPVLRAQLIQFDAAAARTNGINLNNFSSTGTNNAKALFLYPNNSGSLNGTANFADDRRRDINERNDITLSSCVQDISSNPFACRMTISLPNPEGAASYDTREAYLQLAAIYNNQYGTSFQVELLNNSDEVMFDGVQPVVDSTGRASDLFRRVQARVSVKDDGRELTFPNAALSVQGDICKNFFVTDSASDYETECTVPPAAASADGNALILTLCDIQVCKKNTNSDNEDVGSTPALSYTRTHVNGSNNPDANVLGCSWQISDGTTINNQHCYYGDSFKHTYPRSPNDAVIYYTVTLTMRLTTGEKVTTERTKIPH